MLYPNYRKDTSYRHDLLYYNTANVVVANRSNIRFRQVTIFWTQTVRDLHEITKLYYIETTEKAYIISSIRVAFGIIPEI